MGVYLCAKCQDSSITLTSFRQGVILPPLSPQNEPLKSPPRLRLKYLRLITSWQWYQKFHSGKRSRTNIKIVKTQVFILVNKILVLKILHLFVKYFQNEAFDSTIYGKKSMCSFFWDFALLCRILYECHVNS